MRLIDADALIENHFSDEHRIALSYADKLWMRRIISDEPTIDAVPVVRCKDCKYAKIHIDIIGYMHLFCGLATNRVEMEFDDFCSYGERKEKE